MFFLTKETLLTKKKKKKHAAMIIEARKEAVERWILLGSSFFLKTPDFKAQDDRNKPQVYKSLGFEGWLPKF